MRLCDWQGTQMFMKPSNHSSFFPAHLPSDFVCTMAKTKDLAAVKRSLRVARAGFNKAAGDLEAIIKRRVPKCKKRLRAVRQMEERVKELGGELSDEGLFQEFAPRKRLLGQLQRLQRKRGTGSDGEGRGQACCGKEGEE